MKDLLDPKTLTPESLYELQSETWAQGAQAERERIVKLLQDWLEDDNADFSEAFALIKGEQE